MTEHLLNALSQAFPQKQILQNAPMSRYTTLRLGGPADVLVEVADGRQLSAAITIARELDVPVTVLGNGSNLLVRDGGIRGLVIHLGDLFAEISEPAPLPDGRFALTAQTGAPLQKLANRAADAALTGLEFAGGIPGTVGGGVYMNAGAYGGEMKQVVARVDCFELSGKPVSFVGEELDFGHRHSALQDRDVVAHTVHFRLTQGDGAALRAEAAELNRRRAEKQPLNYPSAGSTFKRPEGNYASALIDQCGLKGFTLGGAQVSEKHAGFLLNRGGTAADFLALMAHVQRVVLEKTGYALEPEVCILGEDAPVTAL